MNETAFETIAQAAVAPKLDFSSEEFAGFAEDHGLFEDEIEVVRSVFAYLKEKKTLGLEEQLSDWVSGAKESGMSKKDALDMLGILWEE